MARQNLTERAAVIALGEVAAEPRGHLVTTLAAINISRGEPCRCSETYQLGDRLAGSVRSQKLNSATGRSRIGVLG
jgi:hypothetical protein